MTQSSNKKTWKKPKIPKSANSENAMDFAGKSGVPFFAIFDKKSKKGVKRDLEKSMAKKGRNLMRKACQKEAKTEAKMDETWTICEKGEKAENYLFYSKKRGFGGVKSYAKDDLNPSEFDAKKSWAKRPAKEAKRGRKWEPKLAENGKKSKKRRSKNHVFF